VYPVVQTLAITTAVSCAPAANSHHHLPNNLDGVELHAHRKYRLVLAVFELWIRSNDGAVVVVVHPLLVRVDELPPSLLSFLALHLILVYCGFGVKLGEVFLEVLVDFIVEFGEAQLGARYFFEDLPVCLDVLHNYTLSLAFRGGELTDN
jgi:hypothetical protein